MTFTPDAPRRSWVTLPRAFAIGGTVAVVFLVLAPLLPSRDAPTPVPTAAPASAPTAMFRPDVVHDLRPAPGLAESADRLRPAVEAVATDEQFAFLEQSTDAPVRWSPCRAIHVVINPGSIPRAFEAKTLLLLEELSDATGLVFVYDGFTAERVDIDRVDYQPETYGGRWAPVLIGFGELDEHGVDFLGLAQNHRRSSTELEDAWQGWDTLDDVGFDVTHGAAYDDALGYVSGTIVLDPSVLDLEPVAGEMAWTSVLRHELGHLVGLDHVEDPMQIMHAWQSGIRTYGDGDRAGLAVLGAGACRPDQ